MRAADERRLGADLGLYSVTFNNDVELDRRTLEAYKAFRIEAETKGFRHFLEVFDPERPASIRRPTWPRFINDHIVRALAGVTSRGRPLFLKIVYHGPAAMEALARYDRSLVVGILGGSAGTTFDAFHMLWEAKKYGARVALYGRKINNAEHQLSFVEHLRAVADDQLPPDEAVKAYHGALSGWAFAPTARWPTTCSRPRRLPQLQRHRARAGRKPRPARPHRSPRRPPARPTSAR